jgi:hypothetical protein
MTVITTAHRGKNKVNCGVEEDVKGALAASHYYAKRPKLDKAGVQASAENLYLYWTLEHKDRARLGRFAEAFRERAYAIAASRGKGAQ